MKTRITLAMACFIGLALCSTVVAYYPMLIIRECPHCKAHVVQEETISGNTIGATYWTDGKREAKMLPDHPWLAKCPVCGKLSWIDETEKVGFAYDATEGTPHVQAPSEKELIDFLAGHALPKEKEIYLRKSAWHAANDAWRWHPGAKPPFSNEQLKNLEALTALFDESDQEQRILKAEIARKLGRFDECLLLLSYQFEEGYDWAVGFLRKLADDKVRAVKPFERAKQ